MKSLTPQIPALPEKITGTEQERTAAQVLAAAESALRKIEDERKARTAPLNALVKLENTKAKEAAAPYEEIKALAQQALSDYRLSPDVQVLMAERDRAERAIRAAEKKGDVEEIQAAMTAYAERNALVPKSIDAGTMSVRFRSKTVIEGIDEAALPDRYWLRVPDEKLIKADLENVGAVEGVTFRTELTPYCVEKGEEET